MPIPSSRSAGPLFACALALATAATLGGCNQPSELPDTQIAGLMVDANLDEISGIAASRREDGVLWAIDDHAKPLRDKVSWSSMRERPPFQKPLPYSK